MRWELIVTIHDLLIDSDWIVIIEWRVASEHFKNENSESPPVDILIMTFGLNDLRG